jgi:hypothetical protein
MNQRDSYSIQHDGESWRVLCGGVVMPAEKHATFEGAGAALRALDARGVGLGLPLTMRHKRRGARWAVARFDNGAFALYWRGENGYWHSRTGPPVSIVVGTIYPVS